jgi:hypothetical protein
MEAPKPIAITTPAALPKTHEQQPRADALPISAQPSRQSGRGFLPSPLVKERTATKNQAASPTNSHLTPAKHLPMTSPLDNV